MNNYFWHPLAPENHEEAYPRTRYNHGVGKIDFWIDGKINLPIHAMCNGRIVRINSYTDGNFVMVQECTDSMLGRTFYIRYLHGIWTDTIHVNDYISKGTVIGITSTNNGMYNDHLHIDFSWEPDSFVPVQGYLNDEYSQITIDNQVYNIHSINIQKALNYQQTDRGISGVTIPMGYCWLVFAQEPRWIEGDESTDKYIKNEPTIYQNCKSENDNSTAAAFYFTETLSDSFCGPYPSSWEVVNSDTSEGLRRLVRVCYHEFFSIGDFAFVSFAKLLRANICCNSGVYSIWGENAGNLNDMIINLSKNSSFIGTLQDNTDVIPSGVSLEQIKAIYNNFRYPHIYGAELHSETIEYKNLIIQGINSIPMNNGFLESGPYKGYTQYYPEFEPDFLTAYNYLSNKQLSNGQLGYNSFIFYRYKNQINSINPKVN